MVSRKVVIASVALIVVIVVAALGWYYFVYVAPTAVPHPDTLIYETYGEPEYLDPAVDYETAGSDLIQNVYETLLFYVGNSSIEIEPRLATDWSVSADGLKYTFTLRENVTFHDGTPFNASAMKWSLDRAVLINDPDSGAWILQQCIKGGSNYAWHESWTTGNRTQQYEAALEYLEAGGVKVIDEDTLEINIDYMDSGVPTPYPGFKYCLVFSAASAVSPSFVWTHGGLTANTRGEDIPGYFGFEEANLSYCMGVIPGEHNEYMDENTCGTGPFKVVEWTHNVRVVLERNEDYWGTLPKLKRVIRNLVEDYATRQLDLLAGEADIITVDVVHATDFYDITTHEVTEPKVKVIAEIPTLNTINFEMNMVINVTADEPSGVVVQPFSYLKFRKACQMSFDFDTFIDVALGGHAIRLRNVVPEGMLGYDETIPVYSLDLTTAKTLFQEAMDEMGITKITIELFYNVGNEVRKTGCLMLKDNIEGLDVGVSIKVTELDWPTYLKKIRDKELPMFFIGWLPDYPDPDNYIATYCHSELGVYAKRIGYENLTIDALVEQAATEIDETKRLELYHEIQMEMYRQAFYIFAYQPTTFRVMRTWVQGYIYNPMFSEQAYYLMWKEKE